MSALSAREGKDSEAPFGDRSRISDSKVKNVDNNDAIEHPSVRGCLQFLGIREGIVDCGRDAHTLLGQNTFSH